MAVLAPVAAACTASAPLPAAPPRVDPDVALRDAAIAREHALLLLYAAQTAPALVAIRAEHEQHLTALGADPAAAASPASPPSAASPASPPSAASPASLGHLVAAERSAGAAHAADALRASRSLAAVLASLAASESSHPVALG
ncbi:MAG: hypothetical protein NVS3B26_00480 [Mycobacteriales bacterium]